MKVPSSFHEAYRTAFIFNERQTLKPVSQFHFFPMNTCKFFPSRNAMDIAQAFNAINCTWYENQIDAHHELAWTGNE